MPCVPLEHIRLGDAGRHHAGRHPAVTKACVRGHPSCAPSPDDECVLHALRSICEPKKWGQELTVPELERIDVSTEPGPLCAALIADGVCVVEDAVSAEHLSGLNLDLEVLIAATTPEMRNPNHESMIDFYGTKTIRVDGLPDKSETFVEFMLDPVMHEVCRRFLLPNCPDYLLNTAKLIQIGPGESTQRLHRDEEAGSHMPKERP